jgi:glutamine synthetase
MHSGKISKGCARWVNVPLPGSLEEALQAVEADHDFLVAGDVFSEQLTER